MEYNSFYGGRRGASFIIAKSFKSEAEMAEAFQKGGQYTVVNYDEYVIIDTENKNDINNGKIYRRGYNYANDPNGLGGAEYIGQIVGPAGLGPHAEVLNINTVHQKYTDASSSGDDLDYRHGSGMLNTTDNTLVPGAKGTVANRTFDDTTDKIQWEYFSLRDDKQLESTCYIGFKVPYTVIDYTTTAVEPYNASGNYADMTAAAKIDDGKHPYYEKWRLSIPKGVKGDTFQNFRVMTADNTIQSYTGQADDITNQRKVLVYDYWKYDAKKAGEKTTIYLGDFNKIDDVLLAADGTLTFQYAHDDDKVFSKALKYITKVELTSAGKFTVTYNNNRTLNGQGQTYTTNLKWINNIQLADNGACTAIYNDSTTANLNSIKWVTGVDVAANGTLTTTFNNGTTQVATNKIKWLTKSEYNASTGKLIFTYNDNTTESYDYKYINSVTLSDAGQFVVKTNTNEILLNKTIKWPTDISLTSENKLRITYNNNTTKDLDLVINTIVKTAIPTSGSYAYHLLVLYSAPSAQGNISYNGNNKWVDLGLVKDYNGILIGTNIDSTSNPSLDNEANAISYLKTTYPNGITSGYMAGKIVTIGKSSNDKKFYAYDYDNKTWVYLGSIGAASTIKSVIAGDSSVETEALELPTGSLWFVVEGEE